jgi:hypothetical protein
MTGVAFLACHSSAIKPFREILKNLQPPTASLLLMAYSRMAIKPAAFHPPPVVHCHHLNWRTAKPRPLDSSLSSKCQPFFLSSYVLRRFLKPCGMACFYVGSTKSVRNALSGLGEGSLCGPQVQHITLQQPTR